MSEHTNETTIRNLQETLRRVIAERDELTGLRAQNGVAMMKIRDVVDSIECYRIQTEAEIRRLREQIAEKDAKIRELESEMSQCSRTGDSYRHARTELMDATGCDTHAAALDWIRRHRAAESAEQPDTPDAGELVPWDAETFPNDCEWLRDDEGRRGRVVYFDHDGVAIGSRSKLFFRSWDDLERLHLVRWSRDGITWQPCGTRKAVRS